MKRRNRYSRTAKLSTAAIAAGLAITAALAISNCVEPSGNGATGARLERLGDEIAVCGQLFHTGTRVVLWTDPHGYDAYRPEPRFPDEMKPEDLAKWKFQPTLAPLRENLDAATRTQILARGWTLDELRDSVDLFVMHFDVCGSSRKCFKVLHDQRFLSVQFMLDVDGTIYQTMDLKERAFHAKQANDRSIGVEIAHVGAYTESDNKVFKDFYAVDANGPRLVFSPQWFPNGTGILTEDFVGRPARKDRIEGKIHGTRYFQYDFTEQQYQALAKLVATVNRVLPKIAIDAPRDGAGNVLARQLDETEFSRFSGLIGHYHVTDQKNDPGPAFDWERVVREARQARR